MGQSTVRPRVYRFGLFELSVEAAELRKDGVRLKLQDQPFQILCALLERPGELVTREQLRQQLWPEGTFVDFEHGLNTAIKKIRDVLSDDAETPRYIETVPRKGYRFVGALREAGAEAGAATPPASRLTRRLRAALFIVALALVVGLVVLVLRGLSPPYLRISATRQLTFSGDLSPYSTIETDGRRVYYFKWGDGHLYSVPVGGGAESRSATKFAEPVILHISPDGAALLVKEATGRSGGRVARIWLLPTNGGSPRPLGDIEARSAAWSPDGKTIAFGQHDVYLTEDEGATYRRLVAAPGEVSWVRWSRDGRHLRFTVIDSRTSASSMWEAERNGGLRPVAIRASGPLDACCGIWTRDGHHFLFRELRNERTDFWVVDEKWPPFRSRAPLPLSGGGPEMMAATASPLEDALFVVGREASRMVFKFDLARRQLTPLLPEASIQDPNFSPDGKWMVFCEEHTRESVLWRARSDGSEWQQLTDRKLHVNHARFSHDGKRIAVMAKWPDQPWKVYWVSAAGGALHELNVPVTAQADPVWTRDDQSIIFGQPPRFFSEPDTSRAIYIHNLQTGSTSKLPGTEGWFSPRLAPDGRHLLALTIDEHKLGLYDLATAQWRLLAEDPEKRIGSPSWSPDGSWAYANIYAKNGFVFRIRVRDGSTEEVLRFGEMIASPDCYAWSGLDGSLLVSCARPNSNIYALRYE